MILRTLGELLSPIHMRAKPYESNCKASVTSLDQKKNQREKSGVKGVLKTKPIPLFKSAYQ